MKDTLLVEDNLTRLSIRVIACLQAKKPTFVNNFNEYSFDLSLYLSYFLLLQDQENILNLQYP